MKKSDIFWQTYLSLEKEFINVSNFIFITDEITTHEHGKEITKQCNSQLETFSPYIADLLIRCCVQIEAISKVPISHSRLLPNYKRLQTC